MVGVRCRAISLVIILVGIRLTSFLGTCWGSGPVDIWRFILVFCGTGFFEVRIFNIRLVGTFSLEVWVILFIFKLVSVKTCLVSVRFILISLLGTGRCNGFNDISKRIVFLVTSWVLVSGRMLSIFLESFLF